MPDAARLALVALVGALAGCARSGARVEPVPVLESQSSGTAALLQAVSAVNEQVVWVSGHRATFAVTTDGGLTWRSSTVSGDDSLQFRDVHAFDERTAYLLAAGPGDRSRIYHTLDGGATWRLQFRNREPEAFYDCFDFWDERHGIAVSDAVGGRLIVIRTSDGGATWERVPERALPPALEGEAAFAASGTCMVVRPPGHVWIGTGSRSASRVYHSADRGDTWSVAATPMVSGEASGITSVAPLGGRRVVALGGRLGAGREPADSIAASEDGGSTWVITGRPGLRGAVYGSAPVPGAGWLVAAGPGGLALSRDAGASWVTLDTLAYWAVGFGSRRVGWAVGPGGRITRIRLR